MTTLMLVGATGLVGGATLRQAQGDARVSRVVALTRRPLPRHPKLENPLVISSTYPPMSVVGGGQRGLHPRHHHPQGGLAGGVPSGRP
ncbi:hypothetical protein [Microvirga makkahensis]|uniref:hypothetical protein n=1 Tax=Microvirga makkahensis TaxID=1128670 RepID=UPI00197C7784|nr:hypothetical protein [Microvirga makkahensis]